MSTDFDVIIVGGGISGLIAANKLHEKGFKTLVIERDSTLGGRVKTEIFEDAKFDSGAQFITVRKKAFANIMEDWKAKGLIKLFSRGLPINYNPDKKDNYQRFTFINSNQSLIEYLSKDLEVLTDTQVFNTEVTNNGWVVRANKRREFNAKALVLTPPLPQTMYVLHNGHYQFKDEQLKNNLKAVDYEPTIEVLIILENKCELPKPGATKLEYSNLSWICDNSEKGISDKPCLSVHFSNNFSRLNYRQTDDWIINHTYEYLSEWIKTPFVKAKINRFPYSKPNTIIDKRAILVDKTNPLVLAGDAFGGPKIEGATLSGYKASLLIRKTFKNKQ